jgi:hypothetical protein
MSDNDSFNAYEKWLSISPEDQPPNYYQLLGVEMFVSDVERITEAADRRMTHIRTFQTGPRGALTQQILNELSAARICLMDEATRVKYDRRLRGEPVAQDVQIVVPSRIVSPMAPLGTAPANPMAPLSALRDDPSSPMNSMAPPSAGPANPAIGPLVTPAAARSGRRRKKSLVGTLLLTAAAIGGVAGAVWGIGRLMNQGQETVDDGGQPREEPTTDPAGDVATSDSTMVMQEANGHVNLTPVTAKLQGGDLTLQSDGPDTLVTNWTTTNQWVEWKFMVSQTGLFTVQLTYSAAESAEGSLILVEIDDEQKQWELRSTKDEDSFIIDKFFMAINTLGEHNLIVRAKLLRGSQLMKLKSIELILKGS